MAILTSTPGAENQVSVYDVPDDVLTQYAISGEKAAQMFPENKTAGTEIPKGTPEMSPTRLDNAEGLAEVQAYASICICRELVCNPWRCWWHYYYCYC